MQGSACIHNRYAHTGTPSKHRSDIYINTHCMSSLILGLQVDRPGLSISRDSEVDEQAGKRGKKVPRYSGKFIQSNL